MKALSYAEITSGQWDAIREAANRCNATENAMAGYFLAGGEWDAEDSLALANLLTECWTDNTTGVMTMQNDNAGDIVGEQLRAGAHDAKTRAAAKELVLAAMNDAAEHDAITRAIRQLRSWVDITAERLAKAKADWHDDPDSDSHAAYHAPADEQFPREARDGAIIDLVRHYLTEATLSGRSI